MMQSTYGPGGEEDDFAPNPFRSGGGGGPPPPQQQQQQPLQQQPLQDGTPQWATAPPPQQQQQQYVQQQQYAQQQPQYAQQQPAPQFAQQPPQMQQPPHETQPQWTQQAQFPDPYVQQQFQPLQQQQPYGMSGTMDQGGGRGPPAPHAAVVAPYNGPCARLVNCFLVEGYQPYFDLDTNDVATRLTAAVTVFWQPDLFRIQIVGETKDASRSLKGPDLYGPVWITMTLIFLLAATSNLSGYMHHSLRKKAAAAAGISEDITQQAALEVEEFEYDMNLLLRSSTILSLFVAGIPTTLWLACTCLAMPSIPWAMWMCVYGYSMTPYLLAAALCWIPHALFQWLLLTAATAASCLLVVRNLSTPLLQQDTTTGDSSKASPIIMSILGSHFIFLLILKFAFYS